MRTRCVRLPSSLLLPPSLRPAGKAVAGEHGGVGQPRQGVLEEGAPRSHRPHCSLQANRSSPLPAGRLGRGAQLLPQRARGGANREHAAAAEHAAEVDGAAGRRSWRSGRRSSSGAGGTVDRCRHRGDRARRHKQRIMVRAARTERAAREGCCAFARSVTAAAAPDLPPPQVQPGNGALGAFLCASRFGRRAPSVGT